jgi:hypothetical protein
MIEASRIAVIADITLRVMDRGFTLSGDVQDMRSYKKSSRGA